MLRWIDLVPSAVGPALLVPVDPAARETPHEGVQREGLGNPTLSTSKGIAFWRGAGPTNFNWGPLEVRDLGHSPRTFTDHAHVSEG